MGKTYVSKKDKYKMMDPGERLIKEQYEELQKLMEELTEEASMVVEDYIKNISDLSGSIIQIHEHSPLIKK